MGHLINYHAIRCATIIVKIMATSIDILNVTLIDIYVLLGFFLFTFSSIVIFSFQFYLTYLFILISL